MKFISEIDKIIGRQRFELLDEIRILAARIDELRADLDTVAAAVNQLLDDVNQPKQGGVSPELND